MAVDAATEETLALIAVLLPLHGGGGPGERIAL